MTSEDQARYHNIVEAVKNLATAVDEFLAECKDDYLQDQILTWQEQLEQDFLDFAIEIEPLLDTAA